MNKYDQLVKDLEDNKLTITILELAYRECIRRRKDLPEGVKNLLVPKGHGGLILFAEKMRNILGTVHLAYMRGKQEGEELTKNDTK